MIGTAFNEDAPSIVSKLDPMPLILAPHLESILQSCCKKYGSTAAHCKYYSNALAFVTAPTILQSRLLISSIGI